MAFDAQRYAMDYHVIGFQECVSEVARYLITHEGMDIQNPLRMRLLSHLRCFAAQRELSAKAPTNPTANQNWSPSTPHHSAYQPLAHPQTNYASPSSLVPPVLTPRSAQPATSSSSSVHSPISLPTSTVASSPTMFNQSSYTATTHISNYPYVPNLAPTANATSDMFADSNTPTSAASTIPANDTTLPHQINPHQHHQQHYVQHQDQNGSTYTDLSSRNTLVSIGYSNQYPAPSFAVSSTEDDAYNTNNNKPYRPWGSGPEMAY